MHNQIFNYLDYREFLRDFVEEKRKTNPSISFRSIAYRLGCDAGFFNRILRGKRNLSAELTLKLSKILKLSSQEQRFFELLVNFSQARKQAEKDHFFEQMHQFRTMKIKELSVQQYAVCSHWYYVVLRELLHVVKGTHQEEFSSERLAMTLEPKIKVGEVRDALDTLQRLGIVERTGKDAYTLADRFITSGKEIPQVIVNRILIEFMELAREAIDRIPRSRRSMSMLTFSTSEQAWERIQAKIADFRKEIFAIVEADTQPATQVYHMNLHCFPVTKPFKGAEA
ncbi:MAG: TIGR02147 family protein [Fibrobacterota bacterium]